MPPPRRVPPSPWTVLILPSLPAPCPVPAAPAAPISRPAACYLLLHPALLLVVCYATCVLYNVCVIQRQVPPSPSLRPTGRPQRVQRSRPRPHRGLRRRAQPAGKFAPIDAALLAILPQTAAFARASTAVLPKTDAFACGAAAALRLLFPERRSAAGRGGPGSSGGCGRGCDDG